LNKPPGEGRVTELQWRVVTVLNISRSLRLEESFMPLPMVHIAIAVKMYEVEGMQPPPSFLLGSIAPDAIHMREGAGREQKQQTHFHLESADQQFIQRVRKYYQKYAVKAANEEVRDTINQKHATEAANEEARDFIKGYAAHVLADFLWYHSVSSDFRNSVPPTIYREEGRTLYYRETDQVDFNLYHKEEWRSRMWELLGSSPAIEAPQLLTAGEIDGWRDRTLRWFTELSKEPNVEPLYITETKVRSYIDSASERIAEYFTEWETHPHKVA
jgi:hypothetical protein